MNAITAETIECDVEIKVREKNWYGILTCIQELLESAIEKVDFLIHQNVFRSTYSFWSDYL